MYDRPWTSTPRLLMKWLTTTSVTVVGSVRPGRPRRTPISTFALGGDYVIDYQQNLLYEARYGSNVNAHDSGMLAFEGKCLAIMEPWRSHSSTRPWGSAHLILPSCFEHDCVPTLWGSASRLLCTLGPLRALWAPSSPPLHLYPAAHGWRGSLHPHVGEDCRLRTKTESVKV